MALIALTQPFTRYARITGLAGKPLNRRRELQPVGIPLEQLTLPVGDEIDAGDVVWIDPKSGQFRRFDPKIFDTDDSHMLYGVAMQAGTPAATQDVGITAVRLGVVTGFDLSMYDFGKPIFTSRTDAGRLDDNLGTPAAGSEAIMIHVVGRVIPHWGIMKDQADGSRTPAKVLFIEMTQE